ncbi:hypothetical protein [Clostridium tepidum]|nr:hypothetical protein [Clostridium tepidum]
MYTLIISILLFLFTYAALFAFRSFLIKEDKNNLNMYSEIISNNTYLIIGNDNLEKLILNKSFELKDKIYYIQVISDLKKENEYFLLYFIILGVMNIFILIIIIIKDMQICFIDGEKMIDKF